MLNSLVNAWSFLSQSYLCGSPPKTIPDLTEVPGKIALITGGNSGVGKQLAKLLLTGNAKVYLACRNEQSAREVISELKDSTGNEALFLKLDLGDLQSVKDAVAEFKRKEQHLHLLFNNAAVMMPPKDVVTPTGCDLTFAVNVLGHFYLTDLLMPTMIATFKETHIRPRILTVASVVVYFTSFNMDAIVPGPARDKVSTTDLYNQSKTANLLYAQELARRYGDQGIVSIAVNPGNLKTNLDRNLLIYGSTILKYVSKTIMIYPAEWGGFQLLYAGTFKEGDAFNGKFIVPWGREGAAKRGPDTSLLQKELWTWMEQQVENL